MVLIVVNYKQILWTDIHKIFEYKHLSLPAIKSICINEELLVIAKYVWLPVISSIELAKMFGCVVFIETYPEEEVSIDGAKGVRKTWLEGYSVVSEFYSPDYSALPPVPDDYHRTLYWNPMVTPDESGHARIRFYNNSSCTNFSISAETVTSQGMIGINKRITDNGFYFYILQ